MCYSSTRRSKGGGPPTPPVFRPISNPRCSRGACILAQELQLHQLCPKWWAEMDRVPSQLDAASMMRIASTHSSLCCGTIDCEEGDMQISHQEPARGIWDLFITPASSPPATAQGSPKQGHPRVGNDPPWLTHLAELAKVICFGCASDVAKSDAKLAAVQAGMALQAAKAKVVGTSLHERISLLAENPGVEELDLGSILAAGVSPSPDESLPALSSASTTPSSMGSRPDSSTSRASNSGWS